MSINVNDKNLGHATAYAYYKAGGGTMTEAEFTEFMADFGTASQTAVEAARAALASETAAQTAATTATNKATEATTAATTATTKAGEASTSASTATSAKDTAVSASQTATTKATEATTAAATATSAKTDAVAANTAAQSAKTAAQTAQTGAETAAASVSASAEQIATNAADISQLKSEFTALESDGVVPSAEQMLSDKGVTDSVPYHYRKTGGDGADRLYDQIVGGTVCFNQLVNKSNYESTTTHNGITFTNNGDGTVTANGTATARANFSLGVISVVSDHVYIFGTPDSNNSERWLGNSTYGIQNNIKYMNKMTASGTVGWNCMVASGTTLNNYVFKPQFFDLTAMFGTTIADYIYSLEQATAGAGVTFFKSLFPKDYYPYNAGELKSVEGVSAHETVGFNQWDEETVLGYFDTTGTWIVNTTNLSSKNPIKVFPNTNYYVKAPSGTSLYVTYWTEPVSSGSSHTSQFIARSNSSVANTAITTPSNCYGLHFNLGRGYGTTYNNDICINISDPARNGEYEPYVKRSYPLDNSLTLRGIPKLSDGKMYFDGDRYLPDGTVERRYGIRTYQSGDESLADAITDGTNTVYKLTTMTIEESTPYRQLQICDPNGTEEFVSTGIVPVGHETRYPENLRAKIDGLPWDFSSLIAPTEKTTTASRNYTTGNLLIMGNTLYKVTANIANGGTITPNTNVTATTLSEILSALAQ